MTLPTVQEISSLQEELARVKRQAQEQAIEQGIRCSKLEAENAELRNAITEALKPWGGHYVPVACRKRLESVLSQPLTAQLSETERLRDAVIFRARDAMTQIKDQRTMWPGEVDDMDDALKALDAHLGAEKKKEK